MTDNEYVSGGENPGALPGLDAAARDDSVSVPRGLLRELRDGCVVQRDNGEYAWSECNCCYSSKPRDSRYLLHEDDCAVTRLDALLASGPGGGDGGTK